MSLKKYEIKTNYDANGQIVVTIGNPNGDLIHDTPQHHHGQPVGTQPEEGGDHITVLVKELDPPVNNGDLVFTGIEMFQDPSSPYFEVVSVAERDSEGAEVEKDRKRNNMRKVSSNG